MKMKKEKRKKDHIDTIYIDLGLDMNTNIVNIKGDSVWCDVMHEATPKQHIWRSIYEKVNQHRDFVEKSVAHKKSLYSVVSTANYDSMLWVARKCKT